MKKVFILNNLNCANCASMIEEAINSLPEVESASFNFSTKKMKINGDIISINTSKIQAICDGIEDGVTVSEESEQNNSHSENNGRLDFILLVIGIVLFLGAVILSKLSVPKALFIGMYLMAYIILGYDIIFSAIKGIKNKNFFNENFLMSIATIGALFLGEFAEAVGVVLFFKVGEIFERYAVEKSRKEIANAAGLKVDEADVFRKGEFKRIKTDEINIGDVLKIKVGERIAVDGIIKKGSTQLDTSTITGEPVPVLVNEGDTVVSGYINTLNVIEIVATQTVENSMLSKIADAIENATDSKPKIDRFITRFSKIYTPIVIIIATLTAIIPSLITNNWEYWIYTALTFLVISCPCALVLSVPLSYFSGIGKASRKGILFKGGSAIEALSSIKAVALDKTGTITKGVFTVTNFKSFNNFSDNELLSICGSCELSSTHPVAISIVNYCNKNSIKLSEPEEVTEISGKGISAILNGRNILCGNLRLMKDYNIKVDNIDSNGSIVYVAVDNVLCGFIDVSDSIKENSKDAIKALNKMKLHTIMLTGDKSANAKKTADIVGVENYVGDLLPEDKLNEVKKLREKFGSVMFVGDGINDAPVLAGADIGAAMQSGSDLAIESSDVIFMNSDIESVIEAKRIADKTSKIAIQNIIFALVVKALVLILGLFGIANMWFAVFADSGTTVITVINSIRILLNKDNVS